MYILNRWPDFVQHADTVIDALHHSGHVNCSPLFHSKKNLTTKHMNSSLNEQKNKCIKKLAASVAHMGQPRVMVYLRYAHTKKIPSNKHVVSNSLHHACTGRYHLATMNARQLQANIGKELPKASCKVLICDGIQVIAYEPGWLCFVSTSNTTHGIGWLSATSLPHRAQVGGTPRSTFSSSATWSHPTRRSDHGRGNRRLRHGAWSKNQGLFARPRVWFQRQEGLPGAQHYYRPSSSNTILDHKESARIGWFYQAELSHTGRWHKMCVSELKL